MTDDPTTWPVVRLLDAFRDKRIAPSEYLALLATRVETWQPHVNALGDVYLDEAAVQARRADGAYAGTGVRARPLEGVPVVVKDETEIAGRRTTNGSLLWADFVSTTSDPIVERLVDAGAVVHARGLTPEFSVAFWTHSRMWGVTRNPWNPRFDVGGSSGGSAAALAAGMTPLATGSDIGGSIRVPASCCGVVGYKPPSGRIPVAGAWGRDDWSAVGPMARSVADCALVTDVVSGHHPRDHFSLRDPSALGVPRPDVAGLRVALSEDLGDWPVTEQVRAAVRTAAQALAGLGAVVEEVALVVEREALRRASDAHNGALFARTLLDEVEPHRSKLNPYTVAWLADVLAEPRLSVFAGREVEADLAERVDRVLVDHDALLCPVMAVPAFEAGVDHTREPYVLDGRVRDPFHDLHLSEVFNVTGRCPVLAVPVGHSADGVPIGVQVVGRSYDDATVMRVGAALEAALPWQPVAAFPVP